MLRALSLVLLYALSCPSWAKQAPLLYQVDMILFTHDQTSTQQTTAIPTGAKSTQHALVLGYDGDHAAARPYQLLPASSSHLNQTYATLRRQSSYHIIGHYSWLQSSQHEHAIAFPMIQQGGFSITGSMRVRQSHYYLLDTDLVISPSQNSQSGIHLSQKQRLKENVTYYFDNPQIGLLIRVHPV
jgi:hypothetical protein